MIMSIRKHIPNTLTCCNLLSGAVAVVMAFEGRFTWAFLLIILGALFDFCDGASARLLRVSSPIGKELDSLADLITFGLAPSMMLVESIRLMTMNSNYDWGYWPLVGLLMAAFSALRLAKFNVDERQTTSFIGLATPANALFWGSLLADWPQLASYAEWVPFAMMVMMLLSCWLLVCELPFFSLKFHNFAWAENKVRYIFLIGCVLLIIICASIGHVLFAGAACIIWYVIAALIAARLSCASKS